MAIYNSPPVYTQVVDGGQKVTLQWALWSNNVASGDPGTSWTPTFTNLTSVGGSPTITGVYYLLSNALAYFRVIVTPPSGGSTSSTAGTTYISNFPLTILAPATFGVIAGNANASLGTSNANNNNLYPPSWTTLTGQVVLSGLIEAQ